MNLHNLKNTLAFRLTLWHAAVFSIAVMLTLLIFYFRIFSISMSETDQGLAGEIEEFAIIMANNGLNEVKEYMKVEVESDKTEKEDTVFRLLLESGKVIATEATDSSLMIGQPPENLKKDIIKNNGRMICEDAGIGIDESDLPKIFDRFYRCDTSRSEPGIGLGLSLAKAIAKAHGGDIHVKSITGQGSAFIISLPAET
jgi:nitrogen fixation/metabolism regulation signal transduction histidine kinase